MTTMNNEDPADPSAHELGAAADVALPEPVAWVRDWASPQPHCVTSRRYRSAADVDAGVRYEPIYTADQMRAAIAAELSALRQQQAEVVRALDYYRAAFRRERPAYVPATIRLLHDVRGDAPIGHRSVARAGEHECECNQFGAVSVRAEDGRMLGIKPAEFEPVTWRAA